jgi:hypothetical protein
MPRLSVPREPKQNHQQNGDGHRRRHEAPKISPMTAHFVAATGEFVGTCE